MAHQVREAHEADDFNVLIECGREARHEVVPESEFRRRINDAPAEENVEFLGSVNRKR